MATLLKTKEEDDKEKALTSSSPFSTAPTEGAGQALPANAPTSSGRFTNLSKYLNANKNAGLGQRLATKAQGVLDRGEATKQLGTDQLQTITQNTVSVSDDDKTALSAVASGTYTPEQLEVANRLNSSTYTGPTEALSSIATDQENLQNLAKNTGSEEGRFNLLKSYMNRPKYTSGQQNLDRLFLARSTPDIAKIQTLGTQAGELNTGLGSLLTNLQSNITTGTGSDDTAKKAAMDAVTGGIGSLEQAGGAQIPTNRLTQSDYDKLMATLPTSYGLSDAELQRLGITSEQYKAAQKAIQDKRITPEQAFFFNAASGAAPTALQSMTPEQRANYNALQKFINPDYADTYTPFKEASVGASLLPPADQIGPPPPTGQFSNAVLTAGNNSFNSDQAANTATVTTPGVGSSGGPRIGGRSPSIKTSGQKPPSGHPSVTNHGLDPAAATANSNNINANIAATAAKKAADAAAATAKRNSDRYNELISVGWPPGQINYDETGYPIVNTDY